MLALQEYIIQVLKETLLERQQKFNLKFFKQLSSLKEKIEYCKFVNLLELGEGTGRIVFAISSSKVLKIAKSKKGIWQNETEIEIYQNAKQLGYEQAYTKIYDYDQENFSWMICEIAKTISNNREFSKLSGIQRPEEFFDLLHDFVIFKNMSLHDHSKRLKEKYKKSAIEFHEQGTKEKEKGNLYNWYYQQGLKELEALDRNQKILNLPLTKALYHGIQNFNLIPGDLSSLSSYGKTADGKIVLLDYGFTEEVATKYELNYLFKKNGK